MIIRLVNLLFEIYIWLIIIRALLSFFPRHIQYHPIAMWIERVTEPVLYPIRRWLRRYNTGPLDFSPLIAMIGLEVLRNIVISILFSLRVP